MITSNLIMLIAPMVITIAIILFYLVFISKLKLSEKTVDEISNEKIPKQNEMKTVSPAEKKFKPLPYYFGDGVKNLTLKTAGQATSLREETNETEENVFLEPAGDQKETGESKDVRKAFFLYGKVNFEGCKFKFGYLKTLPKYKPIPDECFGCPHILECVGTNGKKSEQYISKFTKEHYRY